MNESKVKNYILQDVTSLEGVGLKTKLLLKKKKLKKYLTYYGIFHKVLQIDQI